MSQSRIRAGPCNRVGLSCCVKEIRDKIVGVLLLIFLAASENAQSKMFIPRTRIHSLEVIYVTHHKSDDGLIGEDRGRMAYTP